MASFNHAEHIRRQVTFLWGEGLTDMVVGKCLLGKMGVLARRAHLAHTGGCGVFWKMAPTMDKLARAGHLVVGLTDLDDAPSPSELISTHFPRGYSRNLLMRVPVIMLEAWLLADTKGFAEYLQVEEALMPYKPETIRMPKITIVDLARLSANAETAADIAPPLMSKARVGRGYTRHILNFTETLWDPWRAAEKSPSLRRTIDSIEQACGASMQRF